MTSEATEAGGARRPWHRRLRDALVATLERTVIVLMLVLVLDVLWQVLSRYVLRAPSSWTDELAVFLMTWTALLGAAVAYARRAHLGLDYFAGKLPARHRRRAALFTSAVVFLFAVGAMIVGGIRIVHLNILTGQQSAALAMPMSWLYLALPVSGCFIALFAAEEWAELRAGTDEDAEEGS
ncbi:TRAP transporter small permease [Kiritimatiella glycovorans]|uniref:Tripartite ATP-independent periplasmic transporter, DctQ subunit n=1 Tax=Kiritimatiella glycovorans TaxID=1307763 RepID=A0A0G3EH52_9BACT|nr:TRAP transporter small permease [Kiritimatiella glycovorans]AKJ64140.1 Tripartite ATP-independent periplasmic transporter, DctQ subunit [Kiritimatiella glycovorans]